MAILAVPSRHIQRNRKPDFPFRLSPLIRESVAAWVNGEVMHGATLSSRSGDWSNQLHDSTPYGRGFKVGDLGASTLGSLVFDLHEPITTDDVTCCIIMREIKNDVAGNYKTAVHFRNSVSTSYVMGWGGYNTSIFSHYTSTNYWNTGIRDFGAGSSTDLENRAIFFRYDNSANFSEWYKGDEQIDSLSRNLKGTTEFDQLVLGVEGDVAGNVLFIAAWNRLLSTEEMAAIDNGLWQFIVEPPEPIYLSTGGGATTDFPQGLHKIADGFNPQRSTSLGGELQ